MTQVKEMTNPELNRTLAELIGVYRPDIDSEWEAVPDYCTDPAASLEVQAAAIAKDKEAYIRNWLLCKYGKPITYYTSVSLPVAAEIADSKPRERAEAAYQTLQGVKS